MANEKITHSVSHQLRLGVSGQQVQYGVMDKNRQRLTTGKQYVTDSKSLQDLLDQDNILSNIYAHTDLVVISPKFVIAPEEIARHDHNYELFKLNNRSNPDERLYRDHSLEQRETQYAGPREILRLLKNKFPNMTRRHISSVFIEQIAQLKSELEAQLQIYFSGEYLYLVGSKSGELLINNSFHCTSAEDVFYFTMLSLEQLKLDPRETEFFLYSSTAFEQPLTDLFKNYSQKVTLLVEGNPDFMEIWMQCE